MTKYRLKKDTPEFKAGTVFDMIENVDVGNVLTMNAPREDDYAFEVDGIDNFDEWFEEIKESGWWKLKFDEKYYFVDCCGKVGVNPWCNDELDECRYSVGNIFKTEELAQAYTNYLKAVATVSQDEGVLMPDDVRRTLARDGTVYTIGINCQMVSVKEFYNTSAGAVYFDTGYHAKSSNDNHPDEWMTIANYDWSRE